MPEIPPAIPERFLPAYRCIRRLEQEERYMAAFIFGSLARGEATSHSDVDVNVIVTADNPCSNINHPIIQGVKLDLTFLSFDQLRARTNQEIARRERMPILAESLIVFDKTNVGLDELLKYHYRLQQKWWVSSKGLLADLRDWDAPLAQLIEYFIATCEVRTKFHYWSAIIDHILEPIGGRQPIAENNCDCAVCQRDLSMIRDEPGIL